MTVDAQVRAAAAAIAKTYAPSTPFSKWSEYAQASFLVQARAALEAAGVIS